MQISGIRLVRPSFSAFTVGVAAAVVFWGLLQASPLGSPTMQQAGATLAALLAGCVARTFGVDVAKGPNHAAVTAAFCLSACLLFHAVWSLF